VSGDRFAETKPRDVDATVTNEDAPHHLSALDGCLSTIHSRADAHAEPRTLRAESSAMRLQSINKILRRCEAPNRAARPFR